MLYVALRQIDTAYLCKANVDIHGLENFTEAVRSFIIQKIAKVCWFS